MPPDSIETGNLFDKPRTRPNLNDLFKDMNINTNTQTSSQVNTPNIINELPEIELTPITTPPVSNQLTNQTMQQRQQSINNQINQLTSNNDNNDNNPNIKKVTIDLNVNADTPTHMTDLMRQNK